MAELTEHIIYERRCEGIPPNFRVVSPKPQEKFSAPKSTGTSLSISLFSLDRRRVCG